MKKSVFSAAVAIVALLTGGINPIQTAAAEPLCTITASDSNTTIQGTNLGDVICITGDNNTVNALGGDDTVIDDGVDNTINLGEGFDFYDGTGGDGSTVDGGSGDDELIGTPGPDELTGGEGDDSLIGGEEDDALNGGLGEDELSGSAGDDTINGEAGADNLDGGDGVDTLTGGDADDSLIGGAGNDTMNGGLGADQLEGEAGEDSLFGEAGVDTLFGGGGDDLLAGGEDLDSIAGGDGINICDFTAGESLTSSCKYDDAAPSVSEITWAPEAIDVGASSAKTRISFTLSDDTGSLNSELLCISGKESFRFYVLTDRVSKTYKTQLALAVGQTLSSPIPSTDFRVLEIDQELTFPLGSRPGSFICSISTSDILGNISDVYNKTTFTIDRTGDGFDDQAPLVSDITWQQNSIDVGFSSVKNHINFSVADETGVRSVSVACFGAQKFFFIAINTDQVNKTAQTTFFDGISYVDSPPEQVDDFQLLNIDYEASFPLGFTPGVYACNVTSYDVLNNRQEVQNKTSLTIIRTGGDFDETGPQVSTITWAQNVVDVGSDAADTRINFTVSDKTGVRDGYLRCSTSDGAKTFLLGFSTDQESKTWSTTFTAGAHTDYSMPISVENFKQLQIDLEVMLPLGYSPGVYACEVVSSDVLNNLSVNRDVSSFTILRTPAGQPSAPLELSFAASQTTRGTLSWAAPATLGDPALVGYVMEYSLDGQTWLALPKSGTKVTSLDVSNLKPDTDYWFRVRGENGGTVGQDTTFMNLNWANLELHTPGPVAPDAPTALVTSNVTSSGYKLDWTPPAYNGGSDITDFKVELSSDGGNTWKLAKISASTSTTLTVNGTSPGTTYQIRVSAINGIGASQYLSGSVKTTATAPTAPRSVASSNVRAKSLTLSWLLPSSNGGGAITDYKVEASSNGGTSWSTVDDGVSTNLAADISNLLKNRQYLFRVTAINGIGPSPVSEIHTVTTLATVTSAPRTLVTSDVQPTSAGISWSAPTDLGGAVITNYRVETSRDGSNWTVTRKATSTSRSLKLTGLAPGTTYQVRIAAINAMGQSGFLTGSITTSATAPAAPRNLAASQPTTSGLTLSWQLPTTNGGSAITDYRVEVASDCATFTAISRAASVNLGFRVTGLKAGTKYCFRVSAVNAIGSSVASSEVSAVTAGNPPAAPTSLSVKASKTSIVLSWKAPTVTNGSAVRSYLVEYSKNNGATWLKVKTTPSTSRSLTITGLKTKTTYLFRVTATNDVGNSPASKNLKVTTP